MVAVYICALQRATRDIAGLAINRACQEEVVMNAKPWTTKVSLLIVKKRPKRRSTQRCYRRERSDAASAPEQASSITLLSPGKEARDELETIKGRAKGSLPPALIPTRWWLVERLPLTATGKIDRLEIHSWLESMSNEDVACHLQAWSFSPKRKGDALESEAEEKIQSMWGDILGLSKSVLSLDTSLFDLGADSVAVIRFTSKARQADLPISYQQVFEKRTIRQLAALAKYHDHGSEEGTQTKRKPGPEPAAHPTITNGEDPREPSPDVITLWEVAAKGCGVDPDDIEDVYLCTPMQEGLMASTARTPAAYVCEFSYRLSDTIQPDHFRESWDRLMLTEPLLRNRIIQVPRAAALNGVRESESHNGEPSSGSTSSEDPVHGQSGLKSVTARCLSADLLQVTVRHTESSWDAAQFDAPMSFGSNLCRCAMVDNAAEGGQQFIIKIHHSLLDGWSLYLMLRELHAALGSVNSVNRGPSFVAFVEHVRQGWDDDQDNDQHARFWRECLAGAPALDFPRTTPSSNMDIWADRTISHTVSVDLSQIGRRYGVTSATVLYAASVLVLGRHGEVDDVVFGVSLSGRDAPVDNIEEMVGPTLATIPFRTRLDRAASVSHFLQAIEREVVKVMPHEHYGLQNIRKLGRYAEYASSFRCLVVVVQPEEQDEEQVSSFRCIPDPASGNPRTIPFTIEYVLQRQSFAINLHFDTSYLGEAEVQSIASHLMCVVQELGAVESECPLSQVRLAGAEESAAVIERNKEPLPFINRCLHEILQEKVEEFQNLPAVLEEASQRSISYCDLEMASTKLAEALKRDCQLGPEVIVPIGFPKTIMAVVTILAVLKAGGAYVTLDLDYPRRRYQQIVDQTGARLILCDPGSVEMFQGLVDSVIPIEDAWLNDPHDSSSNADSNGAGDVAAARTSRGEPNGSLETGPESGSTGTPKGIVLPHSALSTSVTLIARYLMMPPGSRVMQFPSLAVDLSLHDLFVTLLSGGCICLPTEDHRVNRLSQTMKEMAIEFALLTPAVASLIDPEEASAYEF
ncbi:MAG: NRPS [Peltula sp. TS41687]|nr:MAG: NRPS [Peltula sp. TS41687]